MENKVVINDACGLFHLSDKSMDYIRDHADEYGLDFSDESRGFEQLEHEIQFGYKPRHSQYYIDVVEKVENKEATTLRVIPIKGNKYKVFEYDGAEVLITPEDDDYLTVE